MKRDGASTDVSTLRSLLIVVVASLILVLPSTARHAQAQNDAAELFIGIMGLAIAAEQAKRERDSANAADRARTAQEQAAYQARVAAEQALIRRSQTALAALGFYELAIDGVTGPGTRAAILRYEQAFGVKGFTFSEAHVAALERHANSGFSSTAEAQRARALGFSNYDDYAAAKDGGYRNYSEYRQGVNAGARDAVEFRAYDASGFSSLEQYREAQGRGFKTRDELLQAEAAGFDSAEEFRRFLASGLPDRESFLVAEARAATARAFRSVCLGPEADPTAIALACARTLLIDETDQTAMQVYRRLLPTLESQNDEAERQLLAASEALSARNADPNIQSSPSLLAEVARAEVERDAARARLSLANCVLMSARSGAGDDLANWEQACQKAATQNPGLDEIKMLFARIGQLRAQQLALLEEERARLALEEGTKKATDLLTRIAQFNDAGGRFDKALDVARVLVTLQEALEVDDADAVARALESANDILAAEPELNAFIARSEQAELQARARAVDTARTELRRYALFLEDHVATNLLDANTPKLLNLLERVNGLLSSDGADTMINGRAEIERELRRYQLLDKAESFELDRQQTVEKLADASVASIADDRTLRDAGFLLEDIRAFTQAGSALENPLEAARSVNALMQALEIGDAEGLERALAIASRALEANEDFTAFRRQRDANRRASTSDALAIARARAQAVDKFILATLARDPLNEHLSLLLRLKEELDAAILTGDPDTIAATQQATIARLGDVDMDTGLQAALDGAEVSFETAAVTLAENGLAISALNRDVLEGDHKDILILENRTPSAPFVSRNLRGDLVFSGGRAKTCWAHVPPSVADMSVRIAFDRLRELGVAKPAAETRCSVDDFLEADLILLHRGAFLGEEPDYAVQLVKSYEGSDLDLLETIAWNSVALRVSDLAATSKKIEEEVLSNLRTGFGYISLEEPGAWLCVVGSTSELIRVMATHRDLHANDVALFLSSYSAVIEDDAERIFERARQGDCTAIQVDTPNMADFLVALQRERIEHSVSPLWADAAVISSIEAALAGSDAERERRLAALSQKIQSDRALARAQEVQAERERAAQQELLREAYAQEARAALNAMSSLLAPTFDGDAPRTPTEVRTLFPQVADWADELAANMWAYESHTVQLQDYGTAIWNDRRMEAVVVEVSISIFNQWRGERGSRCFVLGYLVDAEFEMLRDPIASDCDGDRGDVDEWMTGREFESRWIVH